MTMMVGRLYPWWSSATTLQLLLSFATFALSATMECGIYLAPSTIPGAGLGMFAGNTEYQEGDLLTHGDIVIPAFEMNWHNGNDDFEFLWDEYVWSASMFDGMEHEVEDILTIHVCSGGMGAAVNCMLTLINAEDESGDDASYTVGNSGVTWESPGAGSFTPYYGRKFKASARIEAGGEIYASYGEKYFKSRWDYRDVPMPKTFDRVDQLLSKFQKLTERVSIAQHASHHIGSDDWKTALWSLLKEQPSIWENGRTSNALPNNETQIESILQTGGTGKQHYNESIRSLDWLEEHGQCMDNIKDGVSTIPDAGRGAFASRFIPQGGLVSPAPLIHIPDRSVFTMYDHLPDVVPLRRDTSRPIHQQLLLNYCFGHGETTLLLCPYGLLTALINHSHKAPNTKLQWSTKNMGHPEWRDLALEEWTKDPHAGLAFEFVALRDIDEGEEILIDYGEEWEAAWQEHVRKYEPPRRNYAPAYELNSMWDLRIRTMEEASYEDDGIHLWCRQTYLVRDGLKLPEGFDEHDGEEGVVRCRVRMRKHDNSYVAEFFDRRYEESATGGYEVPNDIVKSVGFDVPRDAFFFTDEAYERDHHHEWSFRHDMRFPDDMLPEAWKNVKEEEEACTTGEEASCQTA